MDNEMIERVALAIQEKRAEFQHMPLASIYGVLAEAAIKAMREPTEKMLEPVTNADGFFKLDDPQQAWYKMIDAIINE